MESRVKKGGRKAEREKWKAERRVGLLNVVANHPIFSHQLSAFLFPLFRGISSNGCEDREQLSEFL